MKDFRHERLGVARMKVSGKGSKTRYAPLHPASHGLIVEHFETAGRRPETTSALFRALGNRASGLTMSITADANYKTVRGYSARLGFEIEAPALRATAATSALDRLNLVTGEVHLGRLERHVRKLGDVKKIGCAQVFVARALTISALRVAGRNRRRLHFNGARAVCGS